MRKALILSTLALSVTTALAAVQVTNQEFTRKGTDPTILNSKISDAPAGPVNAIPKGEYSLRDVDVQIGSSRYDYQHNGSHGKMLAVGTDGVVHGAFMGGSDISSGRRVQGWCVDTDDQVSTPTNVLDQHTGYTTSGVTSESPSNGLAGNSGVVAMHSSVPANASWIAVDFAGCTLAFNALTATTAERIWPHVALDNEDRMHIICGDATTDSDDIWYRATSNGTSWDGDWVNITNNSNTLSMTSAAAKTAPGAAIMFMQDSPLANTVEATALQWHHDIFYYRSNTNNISSEINAGNIVNVTRYRAQDSNAPLSNLVFAYSDIEGIFDRQVNPQLHIAFSTPPVWADSAYYKIPGDPMTYFLDGGDFANINNSSAIWHFNADTGEWGHIAGWTTGVDENDSRPDPGVFRVATDRVQLSVDPATGYLYAIWNEFFPDDVRDPWTDGKLMPNAEIFAACSADNGLTWGPRVNLTNTSTPGCTEGNCASETFASMAEVTYDGNLLITYMLDLHGGSSIRNTDTNDGSAETDNPIIFTRVPVANVPPHSGSAWDAEGHVGLSGYERSWSFSGGHPDTAQVLDRILVVNEGASNVTLDMVECFHSVIDEFDGTNLYAGLDAWNPAAGDYFTDANDWDGVIPAMDFHVIRLYVGHNGRPVSEQAFKLTFSDETVRWYRYVYADTDVVPFDYNDVASYSSFPVWTRNTDVQENSQPVSFELGQNFPFPDTATTEISFTLVQGAQANLSVFNLTGQKVATLVDGAMSAGSHTVSFDASGLSSGLYFYTLEANGHAQTRKMVLSK